MNIRINMGNINIPILLYADDIVILSETQTEMQTMLDAIEDWCEAWKIKICMKLK